MRNGDDFARAKLIEHNLRLVAHIVKKYDNEAMIITENANATGGYY